MDRAGKNVINLGHVKYSFITRSLDERYLGEYENSWITRFSTINEKNHEEGGKVQRKLTTSFRSGFLKMAIELCKIEG